MVKILIKCHSIQIKNVYTKKKNTQTKYIKSEILNKIYKNIGFEK